MQIARAQFKNGKFEHCRQTLLVLLETKGESEIVFEKLGNVCIKLERYEEATEMYLKCLNINRHQQEVLLKLAKLFF